MTEKVILVDLADTPIGEMEKMEAHKKAKLHRAVSVFVFNSKKQLLLQKRALNKYHSSGLWTNTACTHPKPDETNFGAAVRRLKEEMGLEINELTKIFDFIYKAPLDNDLTEWEFDHVFIGFSDKNPNPHPSEVSEYEYVDSEELLSGIQKYPENFTVWFKEIIERVLSEVASIESKLSK